MASELASEALATPDAVEVKETPLTAHELAQRARQTLTHTAQRLQTTAVAAAQSPAGRFLGGAAAEAARHCGDRARTVLAKLSRGDDEDRWRHADAITRGERWLTLTWYEKALVEKDHHADGAFTRDEAVYAAARLAARAPQPWQLGEACALCDETFHAALRRHHCRLCGRSVCRHCGGRKRPLPALAAHLGGDPLRVCDDCDGELDELERRERAEWRAYRSERFMKGHTVVPYFDLQKGLSRASKARRCLTAAQTLARSCPLVAPATLYVAVEVLEILCRYGPAGLATLVLRREFVEAAELLRKVAGVDEGWPRSAHELTAAIYYLLALNRGERGADPDRVLREFRDEARVDDALLTKLVAASRCALWCYEASPTCVQLVAKQQGLALLFARGFPEGPDAREPVVDEPAFFCAASASKKEVVLAVRGTSTVQDVATDVRAAPAPFPPASQEGDWVLDGDAFAFAGMARAAEYVYQESYAALKALHDDGYAIILTGHSLGAAVASLTAVLLKRTLDRVHCFGFAAPACVDARLADAMAPFVTSVVLGDDVVPRLTARAMRRLVRKLLHERQSCMTHWRADLDAAWGRLRDGLWAPRVRDSLVRTAGAPPALPAAALLSPAPEPSPPLAPELEAVPPPAPAPTLPLVPAPEPPAPEPSPPAPDATPTPPAVDDGDDDAATTVRAEGDARDAQDVRRAALSAARQAGVSVAAGEAAASSCAAAAASGDDDAASTSSTSFYDCVCINGAAAAGAGDNASNEDADASDGGAATASASDTGDDDSDESSGEAAPGDGWGGSSSILTDDTAASSEPRVVVLVAETPPPPPDGSPEESYDLTDDVALPELYVPGNIVHVYLWRGTHRAAHVARTHAVLSDVVVSAAMLADHGMRPYFDAMSEVRAVDAAPDDPPPWQPFGASETCACCHSRFTWHCTSRSETTAYREKHHCRACGALVCDPCSRHRRALPRLGLLAPRRVCDRCFYAGGVEAPSSPGVCFKVSICRSLSPCRWGLLPLESFRKFERGSAGPWMSRRLLGCQ